MLRILFRRRGWGGQLGISVDQKRSLQCLCFGFLIFNANKPSPQSILKLSHCFFTQVKVNGKTTPLQAWTGPEDFETPRFQDSRHIKMERLSALRTARLYLRGNIPGIHFHYRVSRPLYHSATGRIMSMKISNETIGNRNPRVSGL